MVCLAAIILSSSYSSWGAERQPHAEAIKFLKTYFESPPIVTNCVVERRLFKPDGTETTREYFQFRRQPGAYVIRQIASPTPPETTAQPPLDIMTGVVDNSIWYLQNRTLIRIPDTSEPELTAPGQGTAYVSASTLNNVLYWGINDVRPETMKWVDDGSFTGITRRGGKIEGRILNSVGSRPVTTDLRFNGEQMHVFVDLKYDDPAFGNFPSEIRHSVGTANGPGFTEVVYKIHAFETNAVPLAGSFFKLDAYYKPPGPPLPEIIYTNGLAQRVDGGKLEPAGPLSGPVGVYGSRLIYAVLILAVTVGAFLVWRGLQARPR